MGNEEHQEVDYEKQTSTRLAGGLSKVADTAAPSSSQQRPPSSSLHHFLACLFVFLLEVVLTEAYQVQRSLPGRGLCRGRCEG